MPPGGLRINPRGLALRRRTVSHRFAVFSRQSSVFSQSTSVLPIARRTPSRGALVHRRMVRCRTYLGGEPLWRVQDFRKLLVWRRAHAFAIDVRHAVKAFPRTGYADLKAQLVSAAESPPTRTRARLRGAAIPAVEAPEHSGHRDPQNALRAAPSDSCRGPGR